MAYTKGLFISASNCKKVHNKLHQDTMTELSNWLMVHNWQQLVDLTLLIFGQIFNWVGIASGVLLMITLCVLLRRFCIVKFGEKITPNGGLGILITGATSGFGLAMSKEFYKLGFTIFATYFNDQELGYKELKELSSQPFTPLDKRTDFKKPKLFLIHMDVRSRETIETCGKEVESLLKLHNIKLYSLINNAGIAASIPFQMSSRRAIIDSIGTNLTGSMLVTRQFLATIIQNKGRVVNVSSGTHIYPGAGNEVYGATKAAIYYFSLALHDAIKKYGASSHCIIPGNFVAVSNITYTNIKLLESAKKELTTAEKNSYQDDLADFENLLASILNAKLRNSGDNLKEMAAIYKFTPLNSHKGTKKREGFFEKLSKLFVMALTGYNSTIEGALESYKHAVYLKNPPLTLYAGNALYTHVIGPICELRPALLNNWQGSHIVDSVLRKGY